jgi:subtilisin family serine protease
MANQGFLSICKSGQSSSVVHSAIRNPQSAILSFRNPQSPILSFRIPKFLNKSAIRNPQSEIPFVASSHISSVNRCSRFTQSRSTSLFLLRLTLGPLLALITANIAGERLDSSPGVITSTRCPFGSQNNVESVCEPGEMCAMKRNVFGVLLFAAVICLLTSHTASLDSTPSGASQTSYADDQILIKLRGGVESLSAGPNSIIDSVLGAGAGAEVLSMTESELPFLVRLNGKMSVEAAVAQAKGDPRVEYAEPNFLCYTTDTRPNDPFFDEMWGLYNSGPNTTEVKAGADIAALRAWDLTTGSENVVVAVIDTGVYLQHEDLAPNSWINVGEIANNSRDDDGNGFVDDVNGWNFFAGNNRVYSDPEADRHGTHVAGTIGAAGNNGVGVTGVSWRVKLMALKFLDSTPSSIDGAVRAINYVIDQKRRGVNVRVINASWITTGDSRALHDAIAAAGNAGIMFVCGAGNGGTDSRGDDNDATPVYPASWTDIPSLMAVAAIDAGDNLASFSNFGSSSVSIAAPGVSILSTYPPDGSSAAGSYAYMKGTSMAAPHVTGIAALLAAFESSLTPAQIKQRIVATAQPLPSMVGKVAAGGRANAYNALTSSAAPVERPTITAVGTTKKALELAGTGFVGGTMIVEVAGTALPAPRYDSSSKLPSGLYTRMTVKLSKSDIKRMFPTGSPVPVTVMNTTSGERSGVYTFVR